jgi:hypothetical protein
MLPTEILAHRLRNQQLAGTNYTTPAEIAACLGAVQAQDYAQSKWAFGVRLPGLQDADVEQAFANRTIIRTSLLRGTLHIVAARDVRWLLTLVAPRIIASCAARYKELELDEALLSKAKTIIGKVLDGGNQLTREEISHALAQHQILATGVRLSFIIQRAAFDQIICYGTRRGNEFTFTLLDECVPAKASKPREEALAELAQRYFNSHGPASLPDFAGWSGLTLTDAKIGLEQVKSTLYASVVKGQSYWGPLAGETYNERLLSIYLLPAFDEYLIAYRDRSLCLDSIYTSRVLTTNGIFYPIIVVEGQVIGTWKRLVKKDKVLVEIIIGAGAALFFAEAFIWERYFLK